MPYLCRSKKKRPSTMGVTRLKRKGRRNKQTAKARVARMKSLSFQPVIKNVDTEELKASFVVEEAPKKKAAKAKKKEEKVEEPKVEAVAEEVTPEVTEAPKAEVTEELTKKKEEAAKEEE